MTHLVARTGFKLKKGLTRLRYRIFSRRKGSDHLEGDKSVRDEKFQEIVDHANDPNSIIKTGIVIGRDIPRQADAGGNDRADNRCDSGNCVQANSGGCRRASRSAASIQDRAGAQGCGLLIHSGTFLSHLEGTRRFHQERQER
jgi:hypothetical protein